MLKSNCIPSNEKIDNHLKDISSTISEEDIKNIGAIVSEENNIIINEGVIEVIDHKSPDGSLLLNASKKETKTEPDSWNIIS